VLGHEMARRNFDLVPHILLRVRIVDPFGFQKQQSRGGEFAREKAARTRRAAA